MTLQQVLYALTIEECGSMNKAAEKLFLVQSTLTSAIQELEKEIGIPIFVRSHKGITPTADGARFLSDIRGLYRHYEMVMEKYEGDGNYKHRFAVSTQHYSFAVKAFVEMAKNYDVNRFDFSIRETQTKDVIMDVSSMKSEIGILFISSMNEYVINKTLREHELDFHPLIKRDAYVYISETHPLAKEKHISMAQLADYPRLSFEQDEDSYYFAEEVLSEIPNSKEIKACDRATILNLMVGLNGYTFCSGIISDDLNGDGFVAIPFKEDESSHQDTMTIGYITKKNSILSKMGTIYIDEIKKHLRQQEGGLIEEETDKDKVIE